MAKNLKNLGPPKTKNLFG